MLRCLIIASDIGITAPGIVYKTIIKELSKDIRISLIVPSAEGKIDLPVSVLSSVPKGYSHYRIANMFMSIFAKPLFDIYWVKRQICRIDPKDIRCQNVIVSFVSFHNYKSILLGYYLSKKYNIKWVIYSVDAIPSPIGWCKYNRFYKNTCKFISQYISRCDAFFSSNEQMLKYQLGMLPSFDKPSGVMFTPIRTDIKISTIESNISPVFLYTGGLYGPRRIEALIGGFRLFLQNCPTARLLFVGLNSFQPFTTCQDLIDSGNLEVYGYTQELKKFYDEAAVLIDINAYFDNDVFLSSKIVNYLPMMKPIISITGLNSPSRNIFTDDPSIIHCRHNIQEIYDALVRAVSMGKCGLSHRKYYIEQFSVENTVKKFNNTLSCICL